MNPSTYLRQFLSAEVPSWLANFKPGMPFPREDFFSSRIVYYPGSGTDGQPVALFGSSRSAHCFIYVDYGVSRKALENQLDARGGGFSGYHRVDRVHVDMSDLVPGPWTAHFDASETNTQWRDFAKVYHSPFGFLEVLQRDWALDDSHGAERLAVLFLGADGISAYDALFCQAESLCPPFSVVLQDHCVGGNYDRFGGGGLLERIATRTKTLPDFLLVGDNTTPWEHFHQVSEANAYHRDRNPRHRALWRAGHLLGQVARPSRHP